jgi:hypothetical protein
MTVVRVKIREVLAEADGETWTCKTDQVIEDQLNLWASPREVDAGHMYVPDMAMAMADQAKLVFRHLEVVAVEDEDEIPEGAVL